MKIEIVREDNVRKIFDDTEWFIISLEGIDAIDSNIYFENKANGEGINITGADLSARDFVLSCECSNSNLNHIRRKEVISFFNHKYSFKIYVTYMGRTLWSDAKVRILSVPSENIYNLTRFTVSFIRENPYWKSVNEFGENIAEKIGLYGFPAFITTNIGTVYDYFRFADAVDITNEGDVETFMKIIIASTGEVINPKITKDNKYVKILDTMVNGDIYELDFVELTVKKNGESAISRIDRSSDFSAMKLNIGNNLVSYSADEGEQLLNVNIYYNQLYLGV